MGGEEILSKGQNGRDVMQMVWLEDLIPQDHLLRKIEAIVKNCIAKRMTDPV